MEKYSVIWCDNFNVVTNGQIKDSEVVMEITAENTEELFKKVYLLRLLCDCNFNESTLTLEGKDFYECIKKDLDDSGYEESEIHEIFSYENYEKQLDNINLDRLDEGDPYIISIKQGFKIIYDTRIYAGEDDNSDEKN